MRNRVLVGLGLAVLVLMSGRAEATVVVSPARVTVDQGATSTPVSVSLTFDSMRGVEARGEGRLATSLLPSGVTTSPDPLTFQFAPSPYTTTTSATMVFQFVVSGSTAPGAYSLRVTESGKLQAGSASMMLVVRQVVVTPPVTPTPTPIVVTPATSIRGVVPPAVSAGTVDVVVRLLGASIPQDAEVYAAEENQGQDIVVSHSRYISSGLIEAVVRVRADAAPGPRRLRLRDASGADLGVDARLIILPAQSIAAPAQVLTAATLSPRSGTLVAPNDRIYPRGVLTTSGAGTIVGSWRINGTPFDRFAIQVRSGRPVQVTARMPVPPLIVGEHRLELVIESPQSFATAPVRLVGAASTASALRVFSPRDNAALSLMPPYPVFRWSLAPGAVGYELEIQGEDRVLSRRLAEVEWKADPAILRELGPGLWRWRVRAFFPGDVRGEPTSDRVFTIVPQAVKFGRVNVERDPATGRARIAWSIDASGAIYRVEILDAEGKKARYKALTLEPRFVVPSRVVFAAGQSRVRITALGPQGEVLGVSDVVRSSSGDHDLFGRIALAQAAPCEVTALAPPENGTVSEAATRIEAQWSGLAARDEVFLEIDGMDVSDLAIWTENDVVYEPVLPLGVGSHEARISLRGAERVWKFSVQTSSEAAGAGVPEASKWDVSEQWQLSLQAGLSVTKESEGSAAPGTDIATLQASGQGDVTDRVFFVRASGDFAGRRTLDEPKEFVDENRNWMLEGGMREGVFSAKVRAGHAAPDFIDQAEYLTTGLVKSGIQARVGASLLSGAAYQSVTSTADGAESGLGLEQDVSAFALELSKDPSGSLLRVVRINVDDSGGAMSPPRKGSVSGVFGRLMFGTNLDFTVEGARSSIDADTAGEEDRTGQAGRAALTATSSKGTVFTMAVRHRDRDFVNPASDGLTANGTPGNSVELSVAHPFDQGRGSITAAGQYLTSPAALEEGAPNIQEGSGSLSVSIGAGRPVSLSATGTTGMRTSDPYDSLSLPETDQLDLGATATLTETLGRMSLSQTAAYQTAKDRINPLADTQTLAGNVALNGSIGTSLTLAASLGFTRTESDPEMGQTDIIQISAQPSFQFARIWLSLQPTMLYSKTRNEILLLESTAEQYAGLLSWTPPWARSLLSFQLIADWSRAIEGEVLPKPAFDKRYGFALTLQWGASGTATSAPSAAPVALRDGAATRASARPASWNPDSSPQAWTTIRRVANLPQGVASAVSAHAQCGTRLYPRR
ncbi:MAG: hypothetical protein JXO72_11755 [Vicinamibacteria bacterium]|nr:hypothetical protein [Vicinamibacteria bacterium]